MKRFLLASAFALALAASGGLTALAQASITSSLNGSVVDAQQSVVPNATVVV